MALKTTEITDKIKDFNAGRLTRAQLIKFLTEDVRYVQPPGHDSIHGTPERYLDASDPGPYVPGSYDEVQHASQTGLLDRDVFHEINRILYEGGVA